MKKPADTAPKTALILSFPKKRGRPKTMRPETDTGTPELVMKKLRGETAEAIDLCLERGIITPVQHWCAVHLRWLYTLRHGAPTVRTIDPSHVSGSEQKHDDPEWRAEREKEYSEAMVKLKNSGHAAVVSNICIYNARPKFLEKPQALGKKDSEQALHTAKILCEGLEMLAKLWKRNN